MTKVAALVLAIANFAIPVAFLVTPTSAEASVFSFFTDMFSAQAATVEAPNSENSQKMPLLEAPAAAKPETKAVSDIVVEGAALVPVAASLSSADSQTAQFSNEIRTYKIKSGDTIGDIALKFNISANTVLWANNLKRSSTLVVGKTLVILPISGVKHTVISGDTLSTIALKYKGNAEEIANYNDLQGEKLQIGDIIVIPDGEMAAAGTVSKIVANTSNISGYYMRPIKGGIRTQGLHGDNAVDLADSCGLPIYASATGEVLVSDNDSGWNGGYGNYVVISHGNGTQTLYAHMQQSLTSVGARVTQGQEIGLIGSTGKVHGVTGCHVHFEIRNGPVNPF